MTYEEMKAKSMENPEVRTEYEALQPELELRRIIYQARMEQSLTQQQLADATGIHRTDICKLEQGNSNPSYKMLQRIADGLGMKMKLEFIPK
ncbi:MAG: helix-turn-helix transcriptional regulator [Eubacteriales bacterium]